MKDEEKNEGWKDIFKRGRNGDKMKEGREAGKEEGRT